MEEPMITYRDNRTGKISIRGKTFEVTVEENGSVRLSGAAKIEEPDCVPATVDPDVKSSRSAQPTKRRGSR
jgi:hypothetical protein